MNIRHSKKSIHVKYIADNTNSSHHTKISVFLSIVIRSASVKVIGYLCKIMQRIPNFIVNFTYIILIL